jgi:hypothetical protein
MRSVKVPWLVDGWVVLYIPKEPGYLKIDLISFDLYEKIREKP